MNPRLDQSLLEIYERLPWGGFWALLAVVLLAHLCFGKLLRSVVVAVFLLLGTQTWFAPVNMVSRELRWWALGILCVRGVVFMLQAPRPPGEDRTAHHVVTALSVLAVASSLWASQTDYAAVLAMTFAIGMILTFGLLWRLLDESDVIATFARSVTILAFALFLTGFVVAGAAEIFDIDQLIHATGFDLQSPSSRYSGVFYNANMGGILGATVLPIVLATPRQFLGGVAKIRWITVLLIVATVFLSGSRSAVLGSGFSVLVLAVYRFGFGAILALGLSAGAVVLLFLYAPVEDLDETAVGHITRTSRLSTLSGRFELWQTGWDAAEDKLFFGNGWAENRVLGASEGVKDKALEAGGVNFGSNLHNAHLQILVDLGLAGLLLFWAFCFLVLRAGWRVLSGPRTNRSALTVVIFASVVVMMADTMVHGWVFSTGSPSTLVFWGFCAMVLKEVQHTENRRWQGGESEDPRPFADADPEFPRSPVPPPPPTGASDRWALGST